jgi:hypothetical protein
MNKEFLTIILKRFAKGFIASAGAFLLMFALNTIPLIQAQLSGVITDPLFLMLVTAGLLALEKTLQGYNP